MKIELAFFTKKYGSYSLRTKIIIYFLIINMIVMSSLGTIYYWKSTQIMQEETAKNIQNTLSRVAIDVVNLTDSIRQVSDSISANPNIREYLTRPVTDDDFQQSMEDFRKINDIIQSFPYKQEVFKIRIFFDTPIFYSSNKVNLLGMEQAASAPWYKDVNERNGKIVWTSTYPYKFYHAWQENIISCVRVLNDLKQLDKRLGYVSIDLKERDIFKILEATEEVVNGRLFIVNGSGTILSNRDSALIGKSIYTMKGFEHLSLNEKSLNEKSLNEKKFVRADVMGKNSLVQVKPIESLDMNIVSVIPMESISEKNVIILKFLLQSFALILLLSILLAVLLSKNVTGRVLQLIEYVRRVDIEDDDYELKVEHNDELSSLMISFNKMVARNRTLIKEVYQEKVSKKEAEMRALQAQINPHFLYNTMDTINWMALKYKARDIMHMTQLLSRFYRLSLNGGRDIVNIEDEIEHIKTYIDIQKNRFEDDIEAYFDICPELYSYSTIKLLLQPIVENAIFHGIQKKPDQKGVIRIVGFKDGQIIKLRIIDDGAGMDRETVVKLEAGLIEADNHSGSYGLKNITQRIKLYFGEEYGIKIDSEPEKGTCVELFFPAVTYKDS
ncbi:sensor histidine kinase [Paenibacillus sp. MZ04-78.2]|uniref:sensor histidine kinase n=1 Tax=Paenibacillus sp. MZ04-78.2 TaxID=2962034 RepID=UPI0020B7B9CB|nr:sensor histidine kinase [Paenibacillus sp. MZ04-78.2]MCP3773230.1 sensor histidine kinase [Paenibacillus sp. MZ04-78.2]